MNPVATLLTVFSLVVAIPAFAHEGATGVVKERMENFKASQQALKQIIAATNKGDLESVVELAGTIKNWAEQIPDYFPAGSGGKPSQASPAIWADFSGFADAAARHAEAASVLITTAESGQITASIAAAKQLAQTCTACHRSYRLE